MLKHLPITVKTLIAPLFACCMIILIVAVYYSSYEQSREKADEASQTLGTLEQARQLSAKVDSAQAMLGRFSSWNQTGYDYDSILDGVTGLDAFLNAVDADLTVIEASRRTGTEQFISDIRERFTEYSDVFSRTANAINTNPYISTNSLIGSYDSFDALTSSVSLLEDELTEQLQQRDIEARDAQEKALSDVLTATVAAFVMSMLAGIFFGWAISRPIRTLSEVIARMAAGQYDLVVKNTRNRDEIGTMALAVEKFREQLLEKARLEQESEVAVNNSRIRHALSSSNTNLIVTDHIGQAIFVNQSMRNLLDDMQDFLPAISQSMRDQSYDQLDISMLPESARHIESGKVSQTQTTEFNLGERCLRQIISPVLREDGQSSGLVLEWIDLSEQKAKEAQIEAANARERLRAETLQTGADDLLFVVGEALKGDLTHKSKFEGDDVVAQIGDALESFFSVLSRNIAEITTNAAELNTFSTDFETTNTRLFDYARTASQQVEEVVAASNEIKDNVTSVSTAVTQMDMSIKEIASNSEQAAEVAQQGVGIAQSTDKLMRQLSDSSIGIGTMIKVITSIAEQTNLLALNATIEAARAGDAGKGFAVVANEVKELAKETAKATDEISRRISAIQKDSSGAVSAISEISQIILNISNLQGEIAVGIQEQRQATQSISRSAAESEGRTREIADSIAKVSASTEHTLAGAEQAQESAATLKHMAESMHALGAQFTVNASQQKTIERKAA